MLAYSNVRIHFGSCYVNISDHEDGGSLTCWIFGDVKPSLVFLLYISPMFPYDKYLSEDQLILTLSYVYFYRHVLPVAYSGQSTIK
jgi:hypothetical protein